VQILMVGGPVLLAPVGLEPEDQHAGGDARLCLGIQGVKDALKQGIFNRPETEPVLLLLRFQVELGEVRIIDSPTADASIGPPDLMRSLGDGSKAIGVGR